MADDVKTPEEPDEKKVSKKVIADPCKGVVSLKKPVKVMDSDGIERTHKAGDIADMEPHAAVAGVIQEFSILQVDELITKIMMSIKGYEKILSVLQVARKRMK